jgi:hypothetical protein
MRVFRPNVTKREKVQTPNDSNPNSFVYVFVCLIGEYEYCKIGFSTSPEKRLKSIQTSSPEKTEVFFTVNGCRKHEKKAHFILDQYRTNGEWFKCTPQIAVDAVMKAKGVKRVKKSVNIEAKKLKRSKKAAALKIRENKASEFCKGMMMNDDYERIVDHGKYRGRSLRELIKSDPIYLRFFLCNN